MAKDTEKLIRELSLISFLMAERRPVTALEIKRDVEGYSEMNDEAFARRFYADRAELESLGIKLQVEKPSDGYFEAELYSLPPDNYYLPAVEFTDKELAALQTALTLLDGSFAYAEPLRLALQQLTWGRPSPLKAPSQTSVAIAVTGEVSSRELSQRLAKVETAISRRKRIEFSYYTIESDRETKRKVDPYHLLYQGSQFYLVGYSHERNGVRIFRLSRIRSKISYATKAEHDFQVPDDFDPRLYSNRIDWQFGEDRQTARIWISERISWLIEREFGSYGGFDDYAEADSDSGLVFETEYSSSRRLIAWIMGLGENARVLEPTTLAREVDRCLKTIKSLHSKNPATAKPKKKRTKKPQIQDVAESSPPIKPERFARLVALAGILIGAVRSEDRLEVADVCRSLSLSKAELQDDISVLNIVNFGGGSYVLYAEIDGEEIFVDPEPYGDSFAKPARLLPLEAKALVAAIDLIGDHLPEASLASVRAKVIKALGSDPSTVGLQITPQNTDSETARLVNEAIRKRTTLKITYYKPSEDQFSEREVEPYALINGREGWYVVAYDPSREDTRHFKLERIKEVEVTATSFNARDQIDPLADIEGWPRTGEITASRTARVWISPERARWAQEDRTVAEYLSDGSVIIELPFAGTQWLVKEIFKEAGDAAVLEPADARQAVLETAESALDSTASESLKPATV